MKVYSHIETFDLLSETQHNLIETFDTLRIFPNQAGDALVSTFPVPGENDKHTAWTYLYNEGC
jgi:hypothetical protein